MRARLHQVLHLVRDGGEGRVIQLRHLYNITSSSLGHAINVSRYTCITCHLELECGHCQLGSWSRAAVHEVEVQGEPRQ